MPIIGEAAMALLGRRILAEGQRGDFFDPLAHEAFMPSYLPPLKYRGIGRAVLATLRSIPSWPLKESFESLGNSGLPVLLFWGRLDETLPFEQGERLLSALPGAEFRPIEGAGHVPHWEKAGEFNAALISFLNEHRGNPL
jgi:pimeloyl-ACP methyl ester carboxylesterase